MPWFVAHGWSLFTYHSAGVDKFWLPMGNQGQPEVLPPPRSLPGFPGTVLISPLLEFPDTAHSCSLWYSLLSSGWGKGLWFLGAQTQ